MMKCNVRGEKIKITDAIGDYIDSKIGRLDKYFKEEVCANIFPSLTLVYKKHLLKH